MLRWIHPFLVVGKIRRGASLAAAARSRPSVSQRHPNMSLATCARVHSYPEAPWIDQRVRAICFVREASRATEQSRFYEGSVGRSLGMDNTKGLCLTARWRCSRSSRQSVRGTPDWLNPPGVSGPRDCAQSGASSAHPHDGQPVLSSEPDTSWAREERTRSPTSFDNIHRADHSTRPEAATHRL